MKLAFSSLYKPGSHLLKILIFLVIYPLLANVGQAQSELSDASAIRKFTYPPLQLTLEYPSSFLAASAPVLQPGSGNVLLLLTPTNGAARPSINVLQQLIELPFPLDVSSLARGVQEEYRRVGFIDAQVTAAQEISVANRDSAWIEIEFHSNGELLNAVAALIPLDGQHLLFTLIDYPAGLKSSQEQLRKILNSLEVAGFIKTLAPIPPGSSGLHPILGVIVIIAVIMTVAIIRRLSSRKRT